MAYDIQIANSGKGTADIVYRFEFTTKIRNPKTFLYNTGQITDIDTPNWNRPQYYSVTRIEAGHSKRSASGLPCPPVNVGKRSTPDYAKLAGQAVHSIGNRKVFAGQRADAFHVDLGSIFDLGALRPFNEAHLISMPNMNGVNAVQSFNVHTIALQVPITDLSRNGDIPKDPSKASAVIGVWATASRRKSRMWDAKKGAYVSHGPWEQVSRLGNPLFNEVLVPMAEKDKWNHLDPQGRLSVREVRQQARAARGCCRRSTRACSRSWRRTRSRGPTSTRSCSPASRTGWCPGSRTTPGRVESDMLRLNLAIPPAKKPNDGGLVAGDAAGFPNGRRIDDDVVTIELRAIAGATIPLVDPSYTPDGAASAITDGTTNTNAALLEVFPYLGLPGGGYQTQPGTTKAS